MVDKEYIHLLKYNLHPALQYIKSGQYTGSLLYYEEKIILHIILLSCCSMIDL